MPNAPSDVATSQLDWAPVSAAATLPAPASGVPEAAQPVENIERIERGGPTGPEPTRFGDWERNGRCVDF